MRIYQYKIQYSCLLYSRHDYLILRLLLNIVHKIICNTQPTIRVHHKQATPQQVSLLQLLVTRQTCRKNLRKCLPLTDSKIYRAISRGHGQASTVNTQDAQVLPTLWTKSVFSIFLILTMKRRTVRGSSTKSSANSKTSKKTKTWVPMAPQAMVLPLQTLYRHSTRPVQTPRADSSLQIITVIMGAMLQTSETRMTS